MTEYISKLFGNDILVGLAAVGTLFYSFFFPETAYLYGAIAVLIIMVLDLLTKLFSLSRQAGGARKAFKSGCINSRSFFRGTLDKLLVFGVMLIICGCAYKLTIIAEIAIWFTQLVFTLMFLRDVLSILENLTAAGCDVGIFKRVVQKKMDECVGDGINVVMPDPTTPDPTITVENNMDGSDGGAVG